MRRAILNGVLITVLAGVSLSTSAVLAQDVMKMPSGSASSIVTLPAPVIENYWVTAQLKSDGSVVLDGYAPDVATKSYLSALPNTDGKDLEIGDGAPKHYDSVVTYGLRLLSHLQDGRFALRSNVMTVKGTAKSSEDYEAAKALVDLAGHMDAVLAMAEIQPPSDTEAAKPAAEPAPAPSEPAATSPEPASEPAPAEPAAAPETPAEPAAAPVTPQPAEEAKPQAVEPTPAPAPEMPAAPAAPAAEPAPAAEAPMEQPAPAAEAPVEQDAPVADYIFSATRSNNGAIALSGDVPAEAAKSYFGVVAGDVPTTDLTIVENPPENFTASATAGLRALVLFTDGELSFKHGAWSLQGHAPSGESLNSASGLIAALPEGTSWKLDLAGPPAIDVCRAGVADFSANHQILFQSGSANLTDESAAALDALAMILAKCPDAILHVEGHTDSDGDESANLALSVARAEAVADVLAAKGIAAERLYSIGYGETLPVASNDTPAGKQKNRRIVLSVLAK